MSEWRQVSLGDITEWASGGTPPKGEPKYWGGNIPWISASSMDGNRYRDSDLKLTEAGLKKGSKLVETGTILLLVRGGALHNRIPVGIAIRPVSFNQDVKAIKAKAEILPWFLLYWFESQKGMLLGKVDFTGIGAGKFDTKQLQELPVLLPPLEEQEEIVAIAKAFDDKIELNRQINRTLEEMAQAIFKSWFVVFDPVKAKMAAIENGEDPERAAMRTISGKTDEELDALPREQFDQLAATAALFPSSLTDSDLGPIPEGWEVQRVENLLELAYGKALKKSDRVGGGIPVYGSGGVNGSHNASLVSGPGIIVGRKGTVGSIYWEQKDFYPIDTVFYAIPAIGVSLEFLYYLLQTLGLETMNTDAAVPGLNRNNVYRLEVPGYPEELIEEFTKLISPMQKKIIQGQLESACLAEMRDELLPKLLSGGISVGAAEAESPRVHRRHFCLSPQAAFGSSICR